MLSAVTNSSTAAIASLRASSHTQAITQLSIAGVSAILLLLYLSTYALAPRRMWRYPLTLAFWIYVCDLAVAVQFVLVGYAAVHYTDERESLHDWPITSNPGCLCDVAPGHPGCLCRNGVLAWLLQAGLIGSTAFYCCLAHNLYRSVADPFTRPSSRGSMYAPPRILPSRALYRTLGPRSC